MFPKSSRIIVTVIGQDRVGIIATVSDILAKAHINIVDISHDISQTTLQEFFAMIMLADTEAATTPLVEIERQLAAAGEQMGLRIDAQHEDVFEYMHRI